MDPSNSIGYLIKSSGRSFTNEVNAKIKEQGLSITVEQVGILFRLCMCHNVTQKDIAEFFGRDKTTVARVVGTMEKNNLLVRVPSENDKRINYLHLTNKGKEAQSVLAKIAKETIKLAEEGISKEELETCKRVLRKIRSNIENKNK